MSLPPRIVNCISLCRAEDIASLTRLASAAITAAGPGGVVRLVVPTQTLLADLKRCNAGEPAIVGPLSSRLSTASEIFTDVANKMATHPVSLVTAVPPFLDLDGDSIPRSRKHQRNIAAAHMAACVCAQVPYVVVSALECLHDAVLPSTIPQLLVTAVPCSPKQFRAPSHAIESAFVSAVRDSHPSLNVHLIRAHEDALPSDPIPLSAADCCASSRAAAAGGVTISKPTCTLKRCRIHCRGDADSSPTSSSASSASSSGAVPRCPDHAHELDLSMGYVVLRGGPVSISAPVVPGTRPPSRLRRSVSSSSSSDGSGTVVARHPALPDPTRPPNVQVLLVQQRKGRWSLPKGHAEKRDRHVADAAAREAFEECNLVIAPLLPLQIHSVAPPALGSKGASTPPAPHGASSMWPFVYPAAAAGYTVSAMTAPLAPTVSAASGVTACDIGGPPLLVEWPDKKGRPRGKLLEVRVSVVLPTPEARSKADGAVAGASDVTAVEWVDVVEAAKRLPSGAGDIIHTAVMRAHEGGWC